MHRNPFAELRLGCIGVVIERVAGSLVSSAACYGLLAMQITPALPYPK